MKIGRLIDADVLREEVYSWGMNIYEPADFTDAIDDAPTVEAILRERIDKMIAEIENNIGIDDNLHNNIDGYDVGLRKALEIINKYCDKEINNG